MALNRRLLNGTQPATFREALRLDTGRDAMVVAVLPGTREFRPARPSSAGKLEERVRLWAQDRGYGSLEGLVAAIDTCSGGL